jgi:hypothetical protein
MLLIDEITAIQQDKGALSTATPAVRDILFFTYNHTFQIDLPTFQQHDFGDIATNEKPLGDILRQESGALARLFVRDFNPDLSRPQRIKILKQMLSRATDQERALLLNIVQDRRIVGISRKDVTNAYGEQFFSHPPTPPSPPVQGKRVAFEPFANIRNIHRKE